MSIVNDLRLIPNFLKVDSSGSAVFSGSLIITNGITGSISATNTLVSSSTQLTSSFELKGSGIWSGSSQLPAGIISGSSQLSGTTIENLTITNLTTINQTSSVLFSSGSTTHGDFANDTHTFTGSVLISGSTALIGTQYVTGAIEIYSSSNPEIRLTNETTDIQYHIQNGDGGHFQIHNGTTGKLLFRFNSGSVADGNQSAYFFGGLYVSQSFNAHTITGVHITGSIAATNGVVSGSTQITPLLPTGVVSGSTQITLASTTGGTTSSNVQFNSLGIGMAASATTGRIDASGDIIAYSTSDRNFKENIIPISNAIEKITKISGNTYYWKEENKDIHGFEGNDVGVIAQEIELVLPQLVTTRENGYKAVKYDKLVALLIEGIKEQQIKIDNLTVVVENLKKQKGL